MSSSNYRQRLYETYFTSSGYSHLNPADDDGYRSHGRVLKQNILPHLPKSRDAKILEIACGIGYTIEMLLREGFRSVQGIDTSPDQVAVAASRHLPVIEADAFEYLAGKTEEFDCIVASDFIEHLDRDELLRFFDAAARALRPKGRIIVKTVNASSLVGTRGRYVDLTHELSFTEKSLRSAFTVCGFTPLVVAGESIRPFTLKGWIRWIPARIVRGLWKAYLISELAEEGFSIPTEFNLIGVAERGSAP